MRTLITFLKLVLDKLILTPLKQIIPVQKKIVFESFSDYSDNSKILFHYLIDQKVNEEYKLVWLVENPEDYASETKKNITFISFGKKGLINRTKEEIRNVFLSSSCAYYFYTHRHITRTRPKKNQVFFNLTHGLSLKDTRGKLWPYYFNTYTAVTSDFAAELRAKSYDGGIEQMKITGFPRNDLLLRENKTVRELLSLDSFEKTMLWMPTFRRQKGTQRNDAGTQKESDIPLIESPEDWDSLNRQLMKTNSLLIIKPHPAQKLEYVKSIESENIRLVTNPELAEYGIELYELIGQSDAMISDYSSVYIDYLLTNKPIAFTVDDMDSYSQHLGFSVKNPLDYMPGPKLKTVQDFNLFINDLSKNKDDWSDNRDKIRELFHHYKDDKASERIAQLLELTR